MNVSILNRDVRSNDVNLKPHTKPRALLKQLKISFFLRLTFTHYCLMYYNTDSIKIRETNKKNQTSKSESQNQPTNIKKPKHQPQPKLSFFFQFYVFRNSQYYVAGMETEIFQFSHHNLQKPVWQVLKVILNQISVITRLLTQTLLCVRWAQGKYVSLRKWFSFALEVKAKNHTSEINRNFKFNYVTFLVIFLFF